MNTRYKVIDMDRKVLLSALWVFVLFNMIYADIITMLTPGWLERVDTYSKLFDWRVLVTFSVLLEIPIAMTLLSRLLDFKASRWAHTIAVPITILFVILGGSTHPHYLFFGTIEVVTMSLALWLTWRKTPAPEQRLALESQS